MKDTRALFGFHAVSARIRRDAASVVEVFVEASRRDARMQDFIAMVEAAGVRLRPVDSERLDGLSGHARHQGVVALAQALALAVSVDDVLDVLDHPPLLLVLDGVTDPHNVGACLRSADGAGVDAVIVPRDRACGLNATVAKVASGAADSVPYIMVTNLARTLVELKERDIRVVGTTDHADKSVFDADLQGALALVLGAEDKGMRRLTTERCDELVHIPMAGVVGSLNVSVACAVCLYEARRQRSSGR